MRVSLKSITPNIEQTIVEIARVSSKRKDKSEQPEGLINYLINNKHWSPFQHGYITFEIVTSKAIGIQLLRHLSFTFQEFSQRYAKVEQIEDIEFRLQADKNRQSSTIAFGGIQHIQSGFSVYHENTELAVDLDNVLSNWLYAVSDYLQKGLELYEVGLSFGVAKECARMILPMATQTTIFMTGSVRSWIHFIQLRDDGHAQKEAQLVAKEIKKIFKEQCPIISKALNY